MRHLQCNNVSNIRQGDVGAREVTIIRPTSRCSEANRQQYGMRRTIHGVGNLRPERPIGVGPAPPMRATTALCPGALPPGLKARQRPDPTT